MIQLDPLLLPVGVGDFAVDLLAGRQLLQIQQTDLVGRLNLVVVLRVREGQRQKPLLLEVRLVDARERLDDDGAAAQVAGLKGRVFARRALAVVFVADGHPPHAVGLVVAGDVGDGAPLARQLVFDFVHFAVFGVRGSGG